MKKTIAIALAFVAFTFLGAGSGAACSCAGPNPVCSVYWNTDVLFSGSGVRIEHVYDNPPEEKIFNGKTVTIAGPGQYLAHFEMIKAYRGKVDEQVVVHAHDQGSACGYVFELGHEYLVYGHVAPNGEVTTNHCELTQ
jgi:hypothetical protein